METLLLKFAVILGSPGELVRLHGPLFYRWLPDGEKNAITLATNDNNANLKVWFEQCGFVDREFVTFSYYRREVPPAAIPTQAVLDGGPLRGLLELRSVREEHLEALREDSIGDENYIALGKTVVKLLFEPVSNFINILRVNYGQYWIENLEAWDSRSGSLGAYCSGNLQIDWSLDGKEWRRFRPDQASVHATVSLREDFREYISEQDWINLQEICRTQYSPSDGALSVCRAHDFFDNDNLRYALIEGVTALEIAIGEYARNRIPAASHLHKELGAFWNLPLRTQVTSLALAIGETPIEDVEEALKAIDLRNEVIHEGLNPSEAHKAKILALLKVAASFLAGSTFRFPTANPGNSKMSLEQWAEVERRLEEKKS